MTYEDFIKKLKGTNSDHANDQKKLHELLKDLKEELSLQTLGGERLVEMPATELHLLLVAENMKKVDNAGGSDAWNALSEEEKRELNDDMMSDLTHTLGEEVYEALPEAEKRDLNLFVWAGCSMHKDLNSVKGGNKAMMSWWSENGETGPVRLANRDNAAVLNNMATEDVPNPAEW